MVADGAECQGDRETVALVDHHGHDALGDVDVEDDGGVNLNSPIRY